MCCLRMRTPPPTHTHPPALALKHQLNALICTLFKMTRPHIRCRFPYFMTCRCTFGSPVSSYSRRLVGKSWEVRSHCLYPQKTSPSSLSGRFYSPRGINQPTLQGFWTLGLIFSTSYSYFSHWSESRAPGHPVQENKTINSDVWPGFSWNPPEEPGSVGNPEGAGVQARWRVNNPARSRSPGGTALLLTFASAVRVGFPCMGL